MSYNGIGLSTAKGSGTSGFIQKTDSQKVTPDEGKLFLKRQLEAKKVEYQEKQDRQMALPTDEYILQHERDRRLEVQVSEYMDQLQDEGNYSPGEIDQLVSQFRLKVSADGESTTIGESTSYKSRINPFES